MMKPSSQFSRFTTMLISQTDHHVDGTKRPIRPNTSPHHLAVEVRRLRRRTTPMTYIRTWPIKPVRPDRSMDPEDVLQYGMATTKPGAINIIKFEASTKHRCHLNYVAM